MRRYTLTVILSLLIAAVVSAQDYKVNLRWDHYYSGQQVEQAIKQLADTYNDFATLESLGKSEEGHDIWMLQINNPATGRDSEKPGIYVDGAVHGNEIQATEVCLYLAWYLLENYDQIESVREAVDRNAFYIVPTVNVDSRWRYFEDAGSYSIGRTARVPYDDDRDGLVDEDDYDDIDGDGEILQMRIKDPTGPYKSHPDDPRAMIRREPWEQGEWRLLGREGIDNDGDGEINEDIPGYLDMNRNYGGNWQPSYVQSGAGDFPLSAKVTNAIGRFVATKPNLVFNWAFHNHGGMIVRGPGSKLDGSYPPSDVEVFDYLGEEGEKILPGYRYIIGVEDMYTTYGDFDGFMYQTFGVFGFVQELHERSDEYYRKMENGEWVEPEDMPRELERLRFNDNVAQGTMFKDWTKVNHPQLGEIEIGGWRRFTSRADQPFQLQDLVHRNTAYILFTARHTPEIELELLETKDLGDGLTRIRARIKNKYVLPTLSAMAYNKKLARRDIVSFTGNNVEVVSGGIVRDPFMDQVLYEENQSDVIYTRLPSFGHVDVQWVVKGSGKATIHYQSVKAEDRELAVKL